MRGPLSAVLLAAVVLAAAGGAAAQAAGAGSRADGTISTVAGGPGGPGPAVNVSVEVCGLKSAGAGLYFASGSVVRRVDSRTGRLATVTDAIPSTGAGGRGGGCGVTADASGNVLVADAAQVLVVAARTGRFYGQKMTARRIYAIAGPQSRARGLVNAVDVQLDHAGNVVVADAGNPQDRENSAVGALLQVVAEGTGIFYGKKMTASHIYTVAGTRSVGPERNRGLATRAWLGVTIGTVRVDRAGNLVLGDDGAVIAPSVRVVAVRNGRFYGQDMRAGHIYSIAGDGQLGTSGDGGPATRAALSFGGGVALDQAGNVVVADCGRVRVIAARTGRFYRRTMTAGHIYAIAGTGLSDPPQSAFCLGTRDTGDGGPAAAADITATAVTVDSADNVVLAGAANVSLPGEQSFRVRVVAARTGRFYGQKMRAGHIYTVAGNGNAGSSGNGLLATRAELGPAAVAVDHAGDLLVADFAGAQVRMVPAASGTFFGRRMIKGVIYAVAGGGRRVPADGGVATAASFRFYSNGPVVTADAAGNVLVTDTGRNQVDVVAARAGTVYGRPMTAGHIYIIAGNGSSAFSGDGGPAAKASLALPEAVATDHAGNVLVADLGNNRLRVVAARSGTFYGQQMTAGDIYTIAGDGQSGISGDGGPATAAGIAPIGVAVDGAGNVVEADDLRVRVVAARSGTFYGQQMTAGDIYTIAGDGQSGISGDGGPATAAVLQAVAVAVDHAGNVAVLGDSVIRMVAIRSGRFYGKKMTAGDIYTIAGGGNVLGDGGPATRAALNSPTDIAVGRAGNLLIADLGNGRVRSMTA